MSTLGGAKMSIFKKRKVEGKPQIIFKVDANHMVHVKCPYCMQEIDTVIVHHLDKNKYTQCSNCKKVLN